MFDPFETEIVRSKERVGTTGKLAWNSLSREKRAAEHGKSSKKPRLARHIDRQADRRTENVENFFLFFSLLVPLALTFPIAALLCGTAAFCFDDDNPQTCPTGYSSTVTAMPGQL